MNRNRLYGLTFAVVALAVAGLAGCGNTPTGPAVSDGGTLNGTVLDSDGDGFSDDLEINSTPGTDPNDPTDNPNNVRDSDGDGCSDFDEWNFPNFCDNDPFTNLCHTTYYNAEFGLGFDLPSNAVLQDTSSHGSILFDAAWLLVLGDTVLIAQVMLAEDPGYTLTEWVASANEVNTSQGYVLVDGYPFILASGTDAYLTMSITTNENALYIVHVITNGYVYQLRISLSESALTEAAEAYVVSILDSLCFD